MKSTFNDRQLLLFSATSLKEPEQIKAMIGRAPEFISVGQAQSPTDHQTDHLYFTKPTIYTYFVNRGIVQNCYKK